MTRFRSDKNRKLDRRLGRHLRAVRKRAGMSMASVGALIDEERQTIWRYEHGINAIPATALLQLSDELSIPVEHFFQGPP